MGVKNLKYSTKLMKIIGIFPIRNHYYEPQFNKKDFIGLPAATDFTPPLADSRDKLIELIRATQDTESWISKFPKEFNSKYSKRFIGPNSDRAGAQIADYISAELV